MQQRGYTSVVLWTQSEKKTFFFPKGVKAQKLSELDAGSLYFISVGFSVKV